MQPRDTTIVDSASAKKAGVDVVTGNPMKWVCLCKARYSTEDGGGWMKSTKAAEVSQGHAGGGCLVQTTTLEIDAQGARRPCDTTVWLPGVTMGSLKDAFETGS